MKWGLIARSEIDRGLGIQTYEMWKHLKPDKTLVVIDEKSGFTAYPERFADCTIVRLTHGKTKNSLHEETVRDWWSGLDAVIAVETVYDWDLISWAQADGVRTVIHGNPEFWMATNPQPDTWIWPTTWRLEHLPPGEVVPVPVPDRPFTAAEPGSPLRALHIAGNRAMGDRNGTDILTNAMRRVQIGVKLTIYSQAPVAPIRGARFESPASDRWEMYSGQHALVLPRRYGGLCLPALEAFASGLVVMMSDCPPNTGWPIYPLLSDKSRTLRMQTGPVETYEVPYNVVANGLKHLANTPAVVADYQRRAREWAEANRWSELAERYYRVLDGSRS